jgi:hypothetical protein
MQASSKAKLVDRQRQLAARKTRLEWAIDGEIYHSRKVKRLTFHRLHQSMHIQCSFAFVDKVVSLHQVQHMQEDWARSRRVSGVNRPVSVRASESRADLGLVFCQIIVGQNATSRLNFLNNGVGDVALF